jgi:hypothetical protein
MGKEQIPNTFNRKSAFFFGVALSRSILSGEAEIAQLENVLIFLIFS